MSKKMSETKQFFKLFVIIEKHSKLSERIGKDAESRQNEEKMKRGKWNAKREKKLTKGRKVL